MVLIVQSAFLLSKTSTNNTAFPLPSTTFPHPTPTTPSTTPQPKPQRHQIRLPPHHQAHPHRHNQYQDKRTHQPAAPPRPNTCRALTPQQTIATRNILQKQDHTYCSPKPYLSHGKRYGLGRQKHTYHTALPLLQTATRHKRPSSLLNHGAQCALRTPTQPAWQQTKPQPKESAKASSSAPNVNTR